ncbi:MAG TPA: PilZ domain-containing protein [Terriglobales bacterium]|nr:PilZ domain-containing protein [Terriglobales bacterium]
MRAFGGTHQVDPNLYAEQPGLNPETRKSEDGANYLRRLKTQTEEEVVTNAAVRKGPGPSSEVPYTGKERRRSPRFRCAGSAEFKPDGSDVRMWGTLTDVSLHGCYVEMSTTFPVGTKVDLILEVLGIRVRAQGTVRVSYPFLGMGICLNELEPGQQTQLEQLLGALAGQAAAPDPGLTRQAVSPEVLEATEPAVFLDEVRRYFVNHHLLSREEFFRIAQRCRRS